MPCTEWDCRTRGGRPTAYRVTVPEAGGGTSRTALAAEVLHLRIGVDPAAPWIGTAPLRRASLTAGLLNAVEAALADTFATAPLGSQIVPLPDSGPEDMAELRAQFQGRRGATLVVEGVAQATAAGMNPTADQRREDLTPNLERAVPVETLEAARDAICGAYGVLPGLFNRSTTGPLVREAQRHLAQWQLQPVAQLIAQEASAKLGARVTLDTLRTTQAYDAGGRARAFTALVQGMQQAQEAGIDPAAALNLVNWENDNA